MSNSGLAPRGHRANAPTDQDGARAVGFAELAVRFVTDGGIWALLITLRP